MMKYAFTILTFASLIAAIPAVAELFVDIPDPSLRAAIRQQLGKPEGDITAADMESLTELDASGRLRLIRSLEGLQAAVNLEVLDLSGKKLQSELNVSHTLNLDPNTDFSPFASLTHLTTLNLARNVITKISSLEEITGLKSLNLSFNNLTSFALPENLTSLMTLDLFDNDLVSLRLPDGLSSLITLDLRENNLTSLTLPDGLTSLTSLGLFSTS